LLRAFILQNVRKSVLCVDYEVKRVSVVTVLNAADALVSLGSYKLLGSFFGFEDTIVKLRGKEALLVKIYRELSLMSQDTLIKVAKCMK